MAAAVPAFQAFAQCEDQELSAANGEQGDFFGESVAIDGEWMVAGALGDELPGEGVNTNRGAAYVFRKVDSKWVQWQKLVDSDSAIGRKFGDAVDIGGGVMVIGATGPPVESAYIYRLRGERWVFEDKVSSIDPVMSPGATDGFARSVAIYGNRVLIGAFLDSELAHFSGAAHVFAYIDGRWTPQIKLLPSEGQEIGFFGQSVAIDGASGRLFIGAPRQDTVPGSSGAVYVFEPGGEGEPLWKETFKIKPQDAPSIAFGRSVASDGERIVVGAWGDAFAGTGTGAAFIFELLDGVWTQTQKIHANDAADDDAFGISVAIDGDAFVVGAWEDGGAFDDPGEVNNHGSVYLFHKVGSTWEQTAKLSGSTTFESPSANLGVSVGLSDGVAIAGAHRGVIFDGKNNILSPGKVLVYDASAPVVGDLSGDQLVNSLDLARLLVQWGVCDEAPQIPCNPTPCKADFNADGVVNGSDLGKLLTNWRTNATTISPQPAASESKL